MTCSSCDAVVVSPGFQAGAEFLAPLGLEPEPFEVGGEVLGTLVPSEPTGATAVSGVWVAGNVSDAMAQVVSSATVGLRVGAMVNTDLIGEETRAAVCAHRAELAEFFEPPAWEAGTPPATRSGAGGSTRSHRRRERAHQWRHVDVRTRTVAGPDGELAL